MNLDNKVTTFEDKKILIVDIETSGLLNVVKSKDDLHIMSVGWKTPRGEWKVKSTDDEKDIKKIFEDENNIIVGHNFIGYDIRALEKMFPDIEYKAQIIDTLPLSQYLFNDRPKHGLESWGVDVGFEKVEISSEEWVNLSKEKAIERCERDVLINALVWDKFYNLLMELYDNDVNQLFTPINRANFKQQLLVIQEENKILLDVAQCEKNIAYLEGIIEEKEKQLIEVMPKIPIKTKKLKPKNMFKKDGSLSKAGEEWNFIVQSLGIPLDYDSEIEVIKGYKEPNPQSSTQMKEWLFSLGWKPKIFKEGANGKVPQLRDDNKNLCKSITTLFDKIPQLEALQGLSVAQHRLGYLKAFMDTKDENDYITASWSGMAKTWRVKHKKPIVNLPSNNSEHGGLVRSCLIAPKGKVFCNADLSSLEDLTKQSEIYPYDPEYVATLNDPNYDAHLNIGLLGGFMTQSQVDFYKWYDKTHGKDEEGNIIECPVKEFSNMSDEWAEEFKKLSKIRKGCKVTNYSCLPVDNTEVLTKTGWKFYKDLEKNDEVLSYNQERGVTEFCKIKDKFFYKDADVFNMKNKWWNIESTLNHRWFGRVRTGRGSTRRYEEKFFTTLDVKGEYSILNSSEYVGGDFNISRDEASLLGWILSDGYFKWSEESYSNSTSGGKKRFVKMSIAQSKKKFYTEVKDLLVNLCIKYTENTNNSNVEVFNIRSEDSRNFLRKFGVFGINKHEVNWCKIITQFNKDCLESFFQAFFKGDGNIKNKNNSFVISQNEGSVYEAIKLSGFLLGYKVSVNGKGKNKKLTFSSNRYTTGQKLEKSFSRHTDVFCLETDNSTFVIKQDGIITITGNCTYGASANKIAEGADIPLKEAKKLHQAYWDLNWSIKKFAEDRKRKMVDGREWVYSDFSKIWYLLSSPHLVFSVVNQSNGACVFDMMLYFLIKEGIMPIKTVHK